MILSIADIRARHAPPPAAPPAAPPPADDLGEWVAAVAGAAITRTPRADGGYEMLLGRRRVVAVLGGRADGLFVVTNLPAGRVASPPISRQQADAMAMRIARLEALG